MSGFRGILFLAVGIFAAPAALADPIWDPTEIARLSEQAAQLATILSTTIETLQGYDRLAGEIGASGVRSFNSSAPDAMRSYSALVSSGMPTSNDVQALLSSSAMSATQLQQARQLWLSAYQKVGGEGLAISLTVSKDAGAAQVRAQSLAAMAGTSQDLRSDIQSNSAVCLAVLSELGAIEAALTLLLEQQSSSRLLKMTVNGGRA
jgi:hypothetical protein